jgi:very-short-patch-repair endonuclease
MQPSGSSQHEQLAERQGGRLAHEQLTHLGLSRGVIRSWIRSRRLIPTLPRVYALGYLRTDRVARIWDAILYAGPGAYLTGASGAYDLGLLFYAPRAITVATPRRPKLLTPPGIVVLAQRGPQREVRDGIPYAPIPLLLLEMANEGDVPALRRALEVLDYRRMLDLIALAEVLGSGRRGSALLRRAMTYRLPQLAHTKSPLEVDFLLLLEARRLVIPKVNTKVHGIEADMYWPELGLIVELDGDGNHGTPAQQRRDARNTDHWRAHGLTVVRLTHADVHQRAEVTLTGLAAHGVARNRAGAGAR